MPGMRPTLDDLGQFLMTRLRDSAFEKADLTIQGHWGAPSLRRLQGDLAELDDHQRDVARRLVRYVIDSAIHDILFALKEQSELDGSVRLVVDGVDAATLSVDGLHGEAFGPDGWQARFSRYGEAPEDA